MYVCHYELYCRSTQFSSDLKVNVNFVLKLLSIISKQTDPVKDNLLYTNKSILNIYREVGNAIIITISILTL